MKPKLLFFILILISFLFTACNTLYSVKTIEIEITEPASLKLSSKYKTLALRYNNCNVAANPEFQHSTHFDKIVNHKENTDSIASEVYYDVTCSTLGNQFFFDSIVEVEAMNFNSIKISDTISYRKIVSDSLINSSDFNQSINVYHFSEAIETVKKLEKPGSSVYHLHPQYALYNKTQLKEIADTTKADLLISLDYYASLDGIFYNKTTRTALEAVSVNSIWNFYDLNELKYIHSIPDSDTISWQEYSEFRNMAERLLPPRKDAILNAADIMGTNFANKLIPHWIMVQRMYYTSGHVEFKQTSEMVQEGKWMEAATIWKKLANNPNKSIAAKSKFNMALAFEMQGNLDTALQWVVESFHVFGQENLEHYKNCKDYIRILGQRKQDIKHIEHQLNYQQ